MGLQASATATFVDLVVGIVVFIESRTKAVSWTLTAKDVNIKRIVGEALASAQLPAPGPLLDFLDTVTFRNLTVTYTNNTFGIMAIPEVAGYALLENAVAFAGISPSDIAFTIGSEGFAFRSLKSMQLTLPSPFVNPNSLNIEAAAGSGSGDLKFLAALNTAINIPGLNGTVRLALSAAIAGTDAASSKAASAAALSAVADVSSRAALPIGDGGTIAGSFPAATTSTALATTPSAIGIAALSGDMEFTGSLLSLVTIKDFPFVRINTATVAATLQSGSGSSLHYSDVADQQYWLRL